MTASPQATSYRGLYLLTFLFAIGLRLALGCLNTEANDDHYEVIKVIVNETRLPASNEAWQAYHPKLFHVTVAVLLRIFGLRSVPSLILFSNFVNVVAGSISVCYVFLFLK